jgi:hypothetical protein
VKSELVLVCAYIRMKGLSSLLMERKTATEQIKAPYLMCDLLFGIFENETIIYT